MSSCDFAAAATTRSTDAASRVQVMTGAAPKQVSLALMSATPLHGPANLRFALPRDADVSLAVFDVTGRKVSQIVAGRLPAGEHTATWNLLDRSGKQVGGGVYFIRLTAGSESASRPAVVR